MTLSLTGARRTAERTLIDRCVITRDAEGRNDDVFNEATLTYETPPDSDTETIFRGPCAFIPENAQPRLAGGEAGQHIYEGDYRCRIPAEANIPQIGDIVTPTLSTNDPSLVDRVFTVVEVLAGSRTVTRRLRLKERTRGPAT